MSAFNIKEYLNSLPENTVTINVSNKNLTYIPPLNRFTNLKKLYCNNNQLTQLPQLNSSLEILNCYDNELPFKLIYKGRLTDIKRNELNCGIQILKRFKELFMLIKFKKHFRNWLWIKVRLPKIQIQFHPNNLKNLLSSINDEELDEALNNW